MKPKDKTSLHKRITRREFAKSLLSVGSLAVLKNPLSTLIESLALGMVQRASAASADELLAAQRYVSIISSHAPARWAFDNFLIPQVGSSFAANRSVTNAVANINGTVTKVLAHFKYAEYGSNGILLPAIWGSSVPRPGGLSVPNCSSLLQNSIMVRGIDVGADQGHDDGPDRAIQPSIGGIGLHGLMADKSKFPIPLVGLAEGHISHGRNAVGSRKGSAAAPVLQTFDGSTLNPLQNFLGRFLMAASPNASGTNVSLQSIEVMTQETLRKMGEYQAQRIGTTSLHNNLENAETLVRTSIQRVIDRFPTAYLKYLSIMTRSSESTVVAGSTLSDGSLRSAQLISSAQLTSAASFENIFFPGQKSSSLAANFAVTEILLTENLSGSISFGLDQIIHPKGILTPAVSYFVDEHSVVTDGVRASAQNFIFRSLLACIYELRQSLINASSWNQTTIHVASEFGRCGMDDGQIGSDHAPNATSAFIASGRVQGFIPIGNITKENKQFGTVNSASERYAGTWGAGAPVSLASGDRMITYHHVANTIADLIDVDRLSEADSLVAKNGNAFVKGVAGDPTNLD